MKSLLELRREFGEYIVWSLNNHSGNNDRFSLISRDMVINGGLCRCIARYRNLTNKLVINIGYETTVDDYGSKTIYK